MRSQYDGHTEAIFVEDGNIQDGSFTIAEGQIDWVIRIRLEIFHPVAGGE
jgi:hypothetical protein